jgi:RNA polymerase sigma factor (sigma-70 family)
MATAQLDTLMRHLKGLAAGQPGQHRTDRQLLEDFADRRDEGAFTSLVQRHGAAVLRVCRRVLGHEQDAEDAFQATFLVLARHPGTIRKPEALASWLYGVAYRAAMGVKRKAAQRRTHEARLRERTPAAAPSPSWDDVQAILDEEVGRLPEPFRSAFVLCVLDGKTESAAAAEVGVKEGTLSWRLARARQRLRQQLARRGIELSAVLAVLSVAQEAGRAAVPAALAKATIGLGLSVAAGEPAAAIPTHIAALAAGVTRAMFMTKAKIATAFLVALAFAVAGVGGLTRPALAILPEEAPPQADAKPPTAAGPQADGEKGGLVEIRGRVLDPDGKPVPGAKLVFVYASVEKVPDKIWAASAADGAFRFSVTRKIADAAGYANAWDYTYVVAAAQGHGFAWARVRPEASAGLTLRLVKDDVPIRGRVLDLEGKPVAGATVRIDDELLVPADGGNARGGADLTSLRSAGFATLFPPVKTGADGRFQIPGVGRGRVATLRVEGPTIASQQVQAMARPADKAGAAPRGVPFDLLAVPTRPVVGVVRDKETGKPLAGVVVRSCTIGGAEDFNGLVRTTTAKEGRYRLVGLPKGQGNAVMAEAWGRAPRPEDLPYLAAIRKVGNPPGLEPVAVDIGLRRGVWVKGRVIDKATGKGVAAGFDYFCFGDNPFSSDLPLLNGLPAYWTRKDGSFRVVALPGRGLLGVRAGRDEYRMGVGAEQIKGRPDNGQFLDTRPYFLYPGNVHTVAEILPKAGGESITCDVYLDPGRNLLGTAVGPDGKPLAGARVLGMRPMHFWANEPLKTAEFTILALGPDETRTLEMVQEEKKLAGWLVVRGDQKAPARIRLEPWGAVTGRLVRPDGEPMTNVTIYAGSRGGQPDKEGKFRIDGLAAGLKFGLSVIKPPYRLEISGKDIKDLSLRPGERKDLGDVQVKPME